VVNINLWEDDSCGSNNRLMNRLHKLNRYTAPHLSSPGETEIHSTIFLLNVSIFPNIFSAEKQ